MDHENKRRIHLEAEKAVQEAERLYREAQNDDPEGKSWYTASKNSELERAKTWRNHTKHESEHS